MLADSSTGTLPHLASRREVPLLYAIPALLSRLVDSSVLASFGTSSAPMARMASVPSSLVMATLMKPDATTSRGRESAE